MPLVFLDLIQIPIFQRNLLSFCAIFVFFLRIICLFKKVFVFLCDISVQSFVATGTPLEGGIPPGGSHIKLRRKEVSQVTIGPISFLHTKSKYHKGDKYKTKSAQI